MSGGRVAQNRGLGSEIEPFKRAEVKKRFSGCLPMLLVNCA
jgi:hypothetical protein